MTERCIITCFGLFSQPCAQFPHIWTEVSIKFSTNICIEKMLPMSNYLFYMYQLQSIVNSDVTEGLEGCLITCFGLFSQPCTIHPEFLTSELKSPWSCQPKFAPNMHNQYQTVIFVYTNYELLPTPSDLKEGSEWWPAPFLHCSSALCANLTSFCGAVSVPTWQFWLRACCQSHAVINRFESLIGLANQTEPIRTDWF